MFDSLKEALEKLCAFEGELDVAELCVLAEQIEALKIRALRAYERSDAWRTEGFLSAAAGVRSKTRMSEGSANDLRTKRYTTRGQAAWPEKCLVTRVDSCETHVFAGWTEYN